MLLLQLTVTSVYGAELWAWWAASHGHNQSYAWDTTLTGGNYAFSVYGPGGFLTSFAGAVVPSSQTKGKVPIVTARLRDGHKGMLILTLENAGHEQVTYSLVPNDYSGSAQTIQVARGHKETVDWPANADGYYDVTITADSGDGFLRRYAGRIFSAGDRREPGGIPPPGLPHMLRSWSMRTRARVRCLSRTPGPIPVRLTGCAGFWLRPGSRCGEIPRTCGRAKTGER